MGRCGVDDHGLGWGSVVRVCKHGNEAFDFHKSSSVATSFSRTTQLCGVSRSWFKKDKFMADLVHRI
jgi:hypothetical protein